MFTEWNDCALAAVEQQQDVPLGIGRYLYQTPASLMRMVYTRINDTFISLCMEFHSKRATAGLGPSARVQALLHEAEDKCAQDCSFRRQCHSEDTIPQLCSGMQMWNLINN